MNEWIPNPNNAIFVRDSFLSNQSDKILLSSFRKENRRLQANAIGTKIKESLAGLSITRDIIKPPTTEKDLYFEGWDFRYIPESRLLFVWYNPDSVTSRNSIKWIEWVRTSFDLEEDNLITVTSRGFHLDTVMSAVTWSDGKIIACIVCENLIENLTEFENTCKKRGIKVILISSTYWIYSPGIWNKWANGRINTLNVGNLLLWGWLFDAETELTLQNLWIQHKTTNLDQFWLAWWWLHCLTNQI
jgi:N-dimethylarginine dimethylaminohydrolase